MIARFNGRRLLVSLLLVALLAGLGWAWWAARPGPAPMPAPRLAVTRGTLDFVRIGRAELYRPGTPRSVAILLSGDGGWSGFNDRMATAMAQSGTLVLGIDTTAYLQIVARGKGACHSAAADLQMLSQFAQRKLGLPRYLEPVVIGYSAGATIAYVAAQESPSSFRGAISLSFPPDVLGPARPFCAGRGAAPKRMEGGFIYPPSALRVPFTIIEGADDKVVPPGPARSFAAAVPGATYVEVAGLGHGFAGWGPWWGAFETAYAGMAGERPAGGVDDVSDLPLTEVPAGAQAGGANDADGTDDLFVVFLSGDGGWADLDRSVADMMAARGAPVVGWNSLRYFWEERPPPEAAADLARVIEAYAREWKRGRVLLVGYSFGADVLPFMIARLPAQSRARVAGFVSIAGSRAAEFQFSTADWFTDASSGMAVAPMLAKLAPLPMLCVYGAQDAGSVCPIVPAGAVRSLPLPGGHHIGGDFGAVIAPALALAAPGSPRTPG